MSNKDGFKKIAELSGDDRANLKSYWAELYGQEYANAMVQDYKPEGKTQKVQASSKKKVK